MGIFSVYCGFIYNDIFSKSLNIFGSSWNVTNYTAPIGGEVQLDATDKNTFKSPYFYGTDPIWQFSGNKILWSNSFKMKSSIVFGIAQMLFGLVLKYKNCTYFQNRLNIIAEFIPEMIFLNSIFTYLVLTIFGKWIFWPSSESSCAPSLLINLINIFMMVAPEKCVATPTFKGTPTYLFPGQATLQKLLLFMALTAIPWLLCVKPYFLIKKHKKRMARHYSNFGGIHVSNSDSDRVNIVDHDYLDETDSQTEMRNDKPAPLPEFNLEEIVVFQVIHTIEFCLSCISHTASYLRLWALSLAHAELSDVLWNMLLKISLGFNDIFGVVAKWAVFAAFGTLTVGILIFMEGLSAFLHALRLHWVEFNSKFFKGEGYMFLPFSFNAILKAPENKL